MTTTQQLIKPAIEIINSDREFSRLKNIPYMADEKKINEILENITEKLYNISLDKELEFTPLERVLFNFLKESISQKRKVLNPGYLKQLLGHHLAAVIERAELIEKNLVIENESNNTIYDKDLMKLLFVIDSCKDILENIKKYLLFNKFPKRDADDYLSSLMHLCWAYKYILNKKEVNIDSLMEETAETKQRELKNIYNVPYA